MPLLSPYLSSGGLGREAPPLPPQYCFPPLLPIQSAWRCEDPHPRRSRAGPKYRPGLKYQTRVINRLKGEEGLVPGPWFCYVDASTKRRYCQPDFILQREGEALVLIGEIKRVFHPDSWWQLERIYSPVVRIALPFATSFICICVCRSFDPAVRLPAVPHLIRTLEEAQEGEFNILVERI